MDQKRQFIRIKVVRRISGSIRSGGEAQKDLDIRVLGRSGDPLSEGDVIGGV